MLAKVFLINHRCSGCVTGTTHRRCHYNFRFSECLRLLWFENVVPATHQQKQFAKHQTGVPLPLRINTIRKKTIGDEMICVLPLNALHVPVYSKGFV